MAFLGLIGTMFRTVRTSLSWRRGLVLLLPVLQAGQDFWECILKISLRNSEIVLSVGT